MFRRDPHNLRHILRRLREDHGIGRLVLDPRRGMPVLLPNGLARLQSFAEALLENGDGGFDAGFVAGKGCDLNHEATLPRRIGLRKRVRAYAR